MKKLYPRPHETLTVNEVLHFLKSFPDQDAEVKISVNESVLLPINMVIHDRGRGALVHEIEPLRHIKTVRSITPEISTFLPDVSSVMTGSSEMLLSIDVNVPDNGYISLFYPIVSIERIDDFCVFLSHSDKEILRLMERYFLKWSDENSMYLITRLELE